MNAAEIVVLAAGGVHLLQIPGVYFVRRELNWRGMLAELDPVNRRLAVAFGLGVIFYVLGTGFINLLCSHSVVSSEAGRALNLLQAAAWAARALQQRFSLGPCWPAKSRWLHYVLSVAYGSLALAYTLVSLVLAPIWS
jgi:hypothetical protein